jgi:transcription termination factor Rho
MACAPRTLSKLVERPGGVNQGVREAIEGRKRERGREGLYASTAQEGGRGRGEREGRERGHGERGDGERGDRERGERHRRREDRDGGARERGDRTPDRRERDGWESRGDRQATPRG